MRIKFSVKPKKVSETEQIQKLLDLIQECQTTIEDAQKRLNQLVPLGLTWAYIPSTQHHTVTPTYYSQTPVYINSTDPYRMIGISQTTRNKISTTTNTIK